MSALTNFFRSVFAVSNSGCELPTSFATTLHDAMRLNEIALLTEDSRPAIRNVRESNQISILTYESQRDLRSKLRLFDDAADDNSCLTIILVLDGNFQPEIRSLIQRRHLAQRLVLLAPSRHLLGMSSVGDLALAAPALGWLQIEFGQDLWKELAASTNELGQRDRLIVLRPMKEAAHRRLM
jgi:hypothetical protein